MANADAALVVIECPHCGTRYQLPYEAIGTKGRTVACAHCGKSWEAHAARPVSVDTKLQTLAEEELDAKMVEAEQQERERQANAARRREAANKPALAVVGGKDKDGVRGGAAAAEDDTLPAEVHLQTVAEIDATAGDGAPAKGLLAGGRSLSADRHRQQSDFSRRQQSLHETLPRAKARRVLRYAALVAVIVVFGGGLMFRTAIVTQFPQLAAPYAAIGLPVNVVGLQFADVRTLESLQDGTEVLVVDGSVESVASRQVAVPSVVITLQNGRGASLYAWSVTPKASVLGPGEAVAFESRLSSPPDSATSVTLTFGAGSGTAKPAGAIADDGGTALPIATGADDKTDDDQDGGP